MFEPLFARLSDCYHLVAPDYPGFGHSDWPDPKQFNYTFDHIASVMDRFTEAMGLSRYTLYMQDYGEPVGSRMALAHPERVQALIVQDAVAHNEGLGAVWVPRRAFWADRAANEDTFRSGFLSLATTRTRHLGDDPNPDRYDPDLWTDELAFLSQPRRYCGARGRPGPAKADCQSGRVMVCPASGRCACAGERIWPTVYESESLRYRPSPLLRRTGGIYVSCEN
jgi:pimeloyl-ACP methyl ester carboxylesterase